MTAASRSPRRRCGFVRTAPFCAKLVHAARKRSFMPQAIQNGLAVEQRDVRGMFDLMRKLVLVLALGTCVLVSGCRDSPLAWSAGTRSPDGKMVARARTFQPSGIGTGEIGTDVDLNWTSGSQSPTLILSFSDGSDAPGDKSVGMNWLSPTHLELTYKGHRTVDFEALKCHGIDITVRDVSSGTTNASQ